MKVTIALVATLLCTTVTVAATTYSLPDPAIDVNPNYGGNTTIVSISGNTYRGPSQYYYVSECAKPDTAGYQCNIMQEDNVRLTSPSRSVVICSITLQSARILLRSGHNYWRQSDTVLAGSVTVR